MIFGNVFACEVYEILRRSNRNCQMYEFGHVSSIKTRILIRMWDKNEIWITKVVFEPFFRHGPITSTDRNEVTGFKLN